MFGPHILCSDRCMGHAEDIGYLFLVISFEEVQAQHRAVAIRQQQHRPFDILYSQLDFVLVRAVLFGQIAERGTIYIDQIHFPVAQLIDRSIDHDPFEPGSESGFIMEVIQRPKGIRKGFLQDIFGVRGISDDTQAGIVHCPGIFLI